MDPSGDRLPQPDQQTRVVDHEKSIDNSIFGYDSSGIPITDESMLLANTSGNVYIYPKVNRRSVRQLSENGGSAYVITPDNIPEVASKVEVVRKSELTLNKEFMNRSCTESYSREIKEIIDNQKDDKLHDQNFPDNYPHLSLGRFKNYAICNLGVKDNKVVFDLEGFQGDRHIEIDIAEGFKYSELDENPIIYGCQINGDGSINISVNLLRSIKADQKVEQAEIRRIETPKDVLDQLKKDFPWMRSDDVFNDPQNPSFDNINGWADIPTGSEGVIINKRLSRLYPENTDDSVSPNQAELCYSSAKNYLKLVELSMFSDDIPTSSPQARREKVMEYLAEFEHIYQKMINLRREMEIKYVGESLIDTSTAVNIINLASHETADKTENVAAIIFGKKEIAWITDNQESRHHKSSAEIHAHEVGHGVHRPSTKKQGSVEESGKKSLIDRVIGLIDTPKKEADSDWCYEEIYNQLLSVIYPLETIRKPVFDCTYHYAVDQDGNTVEQKGGAYQLKKMVDQLCEKFSREVVMKSLMLTFYYQQDRGTIDHKGQKIKAFGDLYDQVVGRGKLKYEEALIGCTDDDYRRHSSKPEKLLVNSEKESENIARIVGMKRLFFSEIYKRIRQRDNDVKIS